MRELVGRVERIDGRIDAAHGGDGEEDDGVFGQVGAVDGEHVALAEAARREPRGHLPHRIGQLRVGDRPPRRPIDEGRLVAARHGLLQDEQRQRNARDLDVGKRTAVAHRARGMREPAATGSAAFTTASSSGV